MPFVTYAIWSNVSSVPAPPLQLHAPAGLILTGYAPLLPVPAPVPGPNPSTTNQPPPTQAPGAPQPLTRWYYLLGNIPGLAQGGMPQTHWSRVWTTLPALGATRNLGFAYTANFLTQMGMPLPPPGITLNFLANLDHQNNLNVTTWTAAGTGAHRLQLSNQQQYLQGPDEHILLLNIRVT
jgi:hypothetical protein